MWGGNLFALVAEALALVAGFMSGTIRRPRLRRDDRPQSRMATLAERYSPPSKRWLSRRPRETPISGTYHVPLTSERSSVPAGVADHSNAEAGRASQNGPLCQCAADIMFRRPRRRATAVQLRQRGRFAAFDSSGRFALAGLAQPFPGGHQRRHVDHVQVPLQQVDGGRPAEVTGPSMPTRVTAWLVSTASRREVPAVLVGQLELSHHARRVVDYRHGEGVFVGCRYRQTFALLFLAGHFRSRASAGISRGTSSERLRRYVGAPPWGVALKPPIRRVRERG
jgi:hypothetical protein